MNESNKADYEKFLKNEKIRITLATYIVPLLLFIIIVTDFVYIHNTNLRILLGIEIMFIYSLAFFALFYFDLFGLRIKKPTEYYFKKFGYEKFVIRYNTIIKLNRRYPIFLIYVVVFSAIMIASISIIDKKNQFEIAQEFFVSIVLIPASMMAAANGFKGGMSSMKDFDFHSSIGCFKMAKNYNWLSEFKKVSQIVQGLKSYDSYIRKNLNLQVGNLGMLYSHVLASSKELMNQELDVILQKLERGDKLDLLRYLNSIIKSSGIVPTLGLDQFYTKVVTWLPLLVAIITVLVTILRH